MRAKDFITDGIGGRFISGMTGGQANSLGGLAKTAAAGAASSLGLNRTAGNIAGSIKKVANIPAGVKKMGVQELLKNLSIQLGGNWTYTSPKGKISKINTDSISVIDPQSGMEIMIGKETLQQVLASMPEWQGQQ
jgi:hypothetical protein